MQLIEINVNLILFGTYKLLHNHESLTLLIFFSFYSHGALLEISSQSSIQLSPSSTLTQPQALHKHTNIKEGLAVISHTLLLK